MNIILSHFPVTISGGAERITLEIGAVLTQLGHNVYLWGPWANSRYFVNFAKDSGLKIIPHKKLSYFKEIKLLRSACVELSIDMILSSSRRYNIISYAATRQLSSKSVPILHGLISTWDKFRKMSMLSSIIVLEARFIWKMILKMSPLIICCSNAAAKDAKRQLKCSLSKFRVIYYGICTPEEEHKSQEYVNKLKSPFRLLLVGRLHPEKRMDLVIPLMQEIIRYDSDIHVDIAGDGEERTELAELIRIHKLDSHIKLLGHCENITKYYQRSNVLIHFRNDEGFGRVYLEAQLNFLPVVCIKGGATSEIVKNGNTGYIHGLDDIKGMAQSILKLKNDPMKYEEMSKNARKWVEYNFTMGAMKNQYDRVIKEIMNQY